MAQIDPSIALSIRPAQIESPLVHAARAAELQGAQQNQFMNMLKMKEFADETRNKNAMTKWLATKTPQDLNSEENLNQLATQFGAQGLALAKQIDDRRKAQGEALYRGAQISDLRSQEEKRRYELGETQRANAIKTISGFRSRQEALDMLYESEANGTIPAAAAENIRRMMPYNEEDFPAFQQNLITQLMTPDARVKDIRDQEKLRQQQDDRDYANYLIELEVSGDPSRVLSKADFLAARNQNISGGMASEAAAAPAPASAVAPAPAPAAASTTEAGLGGTTVSAEGTLLAPGVAKLIGSRDPAAQELGKIIQKRFEDRIKSQQFTGDFRNVELARQKIAQLKKLPQTPEVVADIAAINRMIATAEQGKAPKVEIKMPPGPKAVDEKYAQDYLDWSQGGGADAAANLGQIKSVLDRLASGEALTGKSIGLAPDFFNALVNPSALGAKQQVEEVVQRNLRAVLGAQFTQVEGERLIARAFDARLSPQENAKRLRKLFVQMQAAAQQKQAMAEYYEANETLRGYKGKQPKMQDFFDVLSAPDAPPKGSVDVRGSDNKVYRFPDQKSADAFKKEHGIKD
jgi:hypothetical protein